jgi:hypothetical protein
VDDGIDGVEDALEDGKDGLEDALDVSCLCTASMQSCRLFSTVRKACHPLKSGIAVNSIDPPPDEVSVEHEEKGEGA